MAIKRAIYLFFILTQVHVAWSFPCYLTVIKGPCWQAYDVTVDMRKVADDESILTLNLSKDQLWERASFECSPKETVYFKSHFSPVIWENEAHRTYQSTRYWSFPVSTEGAVAWNMTICFSKDFSEVPLPLNAASCACDRSIVPPVS